MILITVATFNLGSRKKLYVKLQIVVTIHSGIFAKQTTAIALIKGKKDRVGRYV